jgi:hypothetical protein
MLITSELFYPSSDFVISADQFAGPERACIGMMMQRASIAGKTTLDPQHVQAFTRENPNPVDDLATTLGAARSFTEQGFQVAYIGTQDFLPSDSNSLDKLTSTSGFSWQRRPVELSDIERFLDVTKGWVTKLTMAPVFNEDTNELAGQPTLMHARRAGNLVVHNPGTKLRPAEAFQEVSAIDALGLTVSTDARHQVSLMAVQRIRSDFNGVVIPLQRPEAA